jgi:Winged helix-turn-helix DNA-binding
MGEANLIPNQQTGGTMTKRPYPRYHRRHDGILFSILENPLRTNKEIAKATGYSPSQVSRIVCSPDFRALYEVVMHEASLAARSKWLARISAGAARRETT